MIKYKPITVSVPSHFICDICEREYNDIIEVQEKISINEHCGYGSIFGDGNRIELDMCQHCVSDILGQYIYHKKDRDN